MFHNARIQLTVWYLIIIMVISLFFSLVIYNRANEEFTHFETMQDRIRMDINQGTFGPGPRRIILERIEEEAVEKARIRFITSLGFLNLGILIIAGAAGYFLAGRTLRPIKQMVDEQNRFVSDSSHELRTPLTSLRSEIEVTLRNKKLSIETARKVLKSNLEEVVSLQKLSDNLLELAQNGSLVKNMQKEKVSLKQIVEDALRKLEPAAKKKQIKIDNKVKDIKIFGIADRLTEVFVILLDNAIKYSNLKGNVEVVSKQTDKKVEVFVKNFGVGIDEKDLPHIFDRFYRGDKARSEDGYGLGLSIAKKIVESHSGFVSAKSAGGKTEFIIILPV